ncbi:MAG: lytic transglycosylase domain-containing protein [Nevskiaceae bacterium]
MDGPGATAAWRSAAATLLTAFLCAGPAHADQWIYVQRQSDGVRSYSDRKPSQGSYARIKVTSRPTATASCLGLTPVTMQARADRYRTLIAKHAGAHGLSPELVSAVMRVESCYDRHAVSRSGAQGLMQLMPATAIELGVNDSFDPEQNVSGGVRYLAKMFKRFNNDLRLSLAAYNAGPESVAAFKDVPPFPDTQSYVTRILKLYQPKAT